MKQITGFMVGVVLLVGNSYAQVDTAWIKRYNGPGNMIDIASAIALDSLGNIYVTGNRSWGSAEDIAVVKYTSSGTVTWVKRYNHPVGNGSETACDIAVDKNSNVYVAGTILDFLPTSPDGVLIKYGNGGDSLWVIRIDSRWHESNEINAMTLDTDGNILVTGLCWGDSSGQYEYFSMKFDSFGKEVWASYFLAESGFDCFPTSIAADAKGNSYVTGYCRGLNGSDFLTVKYTASGSIAWYRRYRGYNNCWDEAKDIAVDADCNIFVTGRSQDSLGSHYDYVTIKYGPDGDTLWIRRYNGPQNSDDEPSKIALDGGGNIYVTGRSFGYLTGTDFATIKYNQMGDSLWVRRYHYGGDGGRDIDFDRESNVYVTGYASDVPNGTCYATIKYSPAGLQQWVAVYNNYSNGIDEANAIAVDQSGNVYVTCGSYGSGTDMDFVTIKYIQNSTAVNQSSKKEIHNCPYFIDMYNSVEQDGNFYCSLYDLLGRSVIYGSKRSTLLLKKGRIKPGLHLMNNHHSIKKYLWISNHNVAKK